MSALMWKLIDIELIENPPVRLTASDECYYAREYASGKGYKHSDTNNLISNFKKSVTSRGTPSWRYKEQAIAQFAREAVTLLATVDSTFLLAPIPSSKRRDHPEYDSRLEAVINAVAKSCPNAIKVTPVVRHTTVAAAHQSGTSRPTPAQVRSSLSWEAPPEQADGSKILVFLDDVLTSGTTFKECQALARAHAPHLQVVGVFWARTVWDSCDPAC
jgi:hypothetical protein